MFSILIFISYRHVDTLAIMPFLSFPTTETIAFIDCSLVSADSAVLLIKYVNDFAYDFFHCEGAVLSAVVGYIAIVA